MSQTVQTQTRRLNRSFDVHLLGYDSIMVTFEVRGNFDTDDLKEMLMDAFEASWNEIRLMSVVRWKCIGTFVHFEILNTYMQR